MARLGYGEFYNPNLPEGGVSLPAYHGRILFLEAVRRVTPEVLVGLRDEAQRCAHVWAEDWDIRDLAALWDPTSFFGHMPMPVRDADLNPTFPTPTALVLRWAKAFNLLVPWAFRAAMLTLHDWIYTPGFDPMRDQLAWSHRTDLAPPLISAKEREFVFRTDGWNVLYDTRDHAANVLRAEFEQFLQAYLDQMEALAEAQGWVRTPKKMHQRGRDPVQHFEWLALYQCTAGNTYKSIGDDCRVTQQTVGDAVRETAEQIGLPLVIRKGRPRKKKGA